jgi:hypothetical protein
VPGQGFSSAKRFDVGRGVAFGVGSGVGLGVAAGVSSGVGLGDGVIVGVACRRRDRCRFGGRQDGRRRRLDLTQDGSAGRRGRGRGGQVSPPLATTNPTDTMKASPNNASAPAVAGVTPSRGGHRLDSRRSPTDPRR